MVKSIQSIEINKIFCKYCKRNFVLSGLNYETQICYQCEEIFEIFSHSPQLVEGNIIANKERNFLILKTIILGDFFSNKTELFKNYVNSYLNHSYQQTIGLDIAGKDIYHNNRHIRVTISIISHLNRFKVIRHDFYSGTNIAFLVFDTESEDSIKEVENVWNYELIKYENEYVNQAKVLKILIGNNWTPNSEHNLPISRINRLTKKVRSSGYILCNSFGEILKSNISGNLSNLHDIFIKAVSQYLDQYLR